MCPEPKGTIEKRRQKISNFAITRSHKPAVWGYKCHLLLRNKRRFNGITFRGTTMNKLICDNAHVVVLRKKRSRFISNAARYQSLVCFSSVVVLSSHWGLGPRVIKQKSDIKHIRDKLAWKQRRLMQIGQPPWIKTRGHFGWPSTTTIKGETALHP